jgi:ubiquinone/menaquinone biosynthesis C-methylase UbiE
VHVRHLQSGCLSCGCEWPVSYHRGVSHDEARQYYAHSRQREWSRLSNPVEGALEFAVNRRVIARYLAASARVLDIGGGPGRYALWLAGLGHRVVLADLSPELLAIAREHLAEVDSRTQACVEEILQADACDLTRWTDESFDAALCLGPFYHLPNLADRKRAAAELARVLRPGGMAFVALMPRYALLRRTLQISDERHRIVQDDWLGQLLEEGTFENDVPGRFTHGYGARPEEIGPFFATLGFDMQSLVSSEGILVDLQAILPDLIEHDNPVFQRALDVVVETAADPSILGMANHLLYVGQKIR